MQVGDIVLVPTESDCDLRYVGIVKSVDGDYVEFISVCTTIRNDERTLFNLDMGACRDANELIVIGHVDQSLTDKKIPVSA